MTTDETKEADPSEGDDAETAVGHSCNYSLALNRDVVSSFAIVLAGCACLYLILQEAFVVSPERVANIAVLWIASAGAGFLFQSAGVPPLLGSLGAGIILQNAVTSFGLPSSFQDSIQTVGLCVILLISSTEIDTHAIANAGGVSLRLTFLPGLMEATGCALASRLIFGMPWALALSLGFILAAVSPAIVVPGMSSLQRRGYGVEKGIPSLVMAASAFDDIVAITGFSIAIGVALNNHENNLALSAFIHGPCSIFLGAASGLVSGLVLAATRFCPHNWQRTAIALELGLLMTYGYKRIGFSGSGAVGTLMMGVIARLACENKRVLQFAKCSGGTQFLDRIGLDVNIVWDVVIRPLLFGGIGAAFDFSVMPKDSVFKSLAIVIIGLIVRLPTAFLSALGDGLTVKERLFVAFAWTPKATVQAAICSVPLTMITDRFSGTGDFDELLGHGAHILTTSILAILVTAPIGLLSINYLGPILLSKRAEKRPPSPHKQ